MKIDQKNLSEIKVELNITANPVQLNNFKDSILKSVSKDIKVPGFRAGKAPTSLVEKHANTQQLQIEFLDTAINELYIEAVRQQKLRPAAQPEVSITKFVPYDTLEFKATVDVIGKVTLPDYKKFKLAKPTIKVTAKDIESVIDNLLLREAKKEPITRAAKEKDEVIIDFKGMDAKTKEAINGADGKAYPLVLGSNTFIPGFEPQLIGLKAGDNKTFVITFPIDYGVSALRKRKVEFSVDVKEVKQVVLPKLDDKFASSVGPFKTATELKSDIKKQLEAEKQHEVNREFENKLIEQITDKTKVAIPDSLINEQLGLIEKDEKQNIAYRGESWQDHLKSEGVTEEEHRENNRPSAEKRVKTGLTIGAIAEQEGVDVTKDELDSRLQLLKARYPDPQMQAELDKPENRQDILNSLITEKTLAKLEEYCQTKV